MRASSWPGAGAHRRGGDVEAGRAERADPARVEQRLGVFDQRERLGAVLGHPHEHAVDKEHQVLGER